MGDGGDGSVPSKPLKAPAEEPPEARIGCDCKDWQLWVWCINEEIYIHQKASHHGMDDHTPYFDHGTYDMFLFLCILEFDSWCVLSLDLLADICRRRRSWAQIQATQYRVKNAAGVAQCRDLYCWGYTARYPFFDIVWPLWDSELVKDPLKDESKKAPQLGSLEPQLSLWVGGFASYESMAFLFAPLMATGQANSRYWKLSGSQHVLLTLW